MASKHGRRGVGRMTPLPGHDHLSPFQWYDGEEEEPPSYIREEEGGILLEG